MSAMRTASSVDGVPSGPSECRAEVVYLMGMEDARCGIQAVVWCDVLLCASELIAHAQQFSCGIEAFRMVLERGTLDLQIACRGPLAGAFGLGAWPGWGWTIIERTAVSATVTFLEDDLTRVRLLLALH